MSAVVKARPPVATKPAPTTAAVASARWEAGWGERRTDIDYTPAASWEAAQAHLIERLEAICGAALDASEHRPLQDAEDAMEAIDWVRARERHTPYLIAAAGVVYAVRKAT